MIGARSNHSRPDPGLPRSPMRLACAAVGAAGLLVGGLAGCGSSDDVTATRSRGDATVVSSATPSLATTAPDLTVPATTTAPVTTMATTPATSTTLPLPVGAVALGFGVHVVVPDGWDAETDDTGLLITDGIDSVAIEVHARPAGEGPAPVLQQYVDTFDGDFEAVSYSPVTLRTTFGSKDALVQQYGLYYGTYAADDGIGYRGGLFVLVRADGLTVLIDVWNEGDGNGLPEDAATTLRDSLVAAPLLGEAVEPETVAAFRVTSVHPLAIVDGLTGFAIAPGFELTAGGDDTGWARVSNGLRDFEMHAYADIADLDAAMAEADALVSERYTDVVDETAEDEEVSDLGLLRRSIPWTATYAADGGACGGITTAWWDPADLVAHLVIEGFYWMDDGSVPAEAETWFMFDSAASSLPPSGSGATIAPSPSLSR